jgi:hypothetical protein
MKLPLTIATFLLALITFAHTATCQNICACKAPDGSCEIEVKCQLHGCTAICGSKDGCYAKCGNDLIITRFTLKLVNKGSKEIVAALSRITGNKIEFIPRRPRGLFTIDIKNDDIWNALNYLYERGEVKVNGVDWSIYQNIRRQTSMNEKISVDFNNISVGDALNHLSFVSGMHFSVGSAEAEKLITLSLQEVTLREVISRISTQTGIKIEPMKLRASNK